MGFHMESCFEVLVSNVLGSVNRSMLVKWGISRFLVGFFFYKCWITTPFNDYYWKCRTGGLEGIRYQCTDSPWWPWATSAGTCTHSHPLGAALNHIQNVLCWKLNWLETWLAFAIAIFIFKVCHHAQPPFHLWVAYLRKTYPSICQAFHHNFSYSCLVVCHFASVCLCSDLAVVLLPAKAKCSIELERDSAIVMDFYKEVIIWKTLRPDLSFSEV